MNLVAIFDSKKCVSVSCFVTKRFIYFHEPNSVTPFKSRMFYAFLSLSMTFRPPSLRVRGPFICYNEAAKNIAKLPINKLHRQSFSWNSHVSLLLARVLVLRERVTWIDRTITLDCIASSHLTCTECGARSHHIASDSYFSNALSLPCSQCATVFLPSGKGSLAIERNFKRDDEICYQLRFLRAIFFSAFFRHSRCCFEAWR